MKTLRVLPLFVTFFIVFQISETFLKSPTFQPERPHSYDWWQNVIAELIIVLTPLSSANIVCVAKDCFTGKMFENINKAVTVWEMSAGPNPNTTVPRGNAWDTFVVFLAYDKTIDDFMLNHETSAQPLYMFVLPVGATDDDVGYVFNACFNKHVVRAFTIVPRMDKEEYALERVLSVSVSTYNPYINETTCSDTTPVVVYSWNITNNFSQLINSKYSDGSFIHKLPERKVENMNGCRVRVAARASETNLIIIPSEADGNWTLDGPWATVFQAVLQGINAKLYLRKADEESFPDEHEDEDEMFFGRFSSSEERFVYFDFPSAARTQCYTYCVPRSSGRDPVWFLLVGEYTFNVWLLMLVTMFVVAVAYIPMQRWYNRSFGFVLFYFFAAVNSSMRPAPVSDSARIVFVLWSIFVLIMTTAYQAILQGFRTAPPQMDSIRDVPSLLKSSMIIRGPPVFIKVVHNLLQDSNNSNGNNYDSRLIPYAESDDIDEESLAEIYVHLCSSVEFITLNNRKKRHSDGRLRYYKILNYCVLTQTERLVILPKDSPFLEMVSAVILRLTEGGLLAHIMDVPEPFDIVKAGVQALGLSRIKSPLTLLAVGFGVAFIVFVAEIRGSMEWTSLLNFDSSFAGFI